MNLKTVRIEDAKHHGHLGTSLVVLCGILCLLTAQFAHAQQPINCNGMQVGTLSFTAAGGGITGGFTATIDTDGDGKPSLAEAAAKCDEDHFNWYQIVTADTNPPNDAGGNPLAPPYVDPPPGGYGPPGAQWADNLPWYFDEGPDPPAGTPGFSDGFHIDDVVKDPNGDGVNEHLQFFDFPNDADGNSVSFKTWLVSLNEDGSLHSFHDGGIAWTWSNPVTVPGSSDNTTTITQSLITGPSEAETLLDGFKSSVPAEVWDTVINDSTSPIDWGPGIWTRDGNEIGQTQPGGVSQPGINPPEIVSDHKILPETPNDFHFTAFLPDVDVLIEVWAFWEASNNFEFDFDLFTVPGVLEFDLQYFFGDDLLIVDSVTDLDPEFLLYSGPISDFDPTILNIGQGLGSLTGHTRSMATMAATALPEPSSLVLILLGSFGFALVTRRRHTEA